MRTGFRSNGFIVPHSHFGGLIDGSIINNTYNTGTHSLSGDIFEQNCTVIGTLQTFNPANGKCYKINVSDTLTLASTGVITCSANDYLGVQSNVNGGTGFSPIGSLGGSGSGGNAGNSGNGSPGDPEGSDARIYFGGNGGDGGTTDEGAGGGDGGGYNLGPIADVNSIFSQLLINNGMFWVRSDLENPSNYIASPINGGCGGGGCGNSGTPTAGGGGCGGGVVYISADTIILNGGSITANGQDVWTETGGGGGGGGGVIIVCNELIWNSTDSTITATGGTGGDLDADDGLDGTILIVSNQLVSTFVGEVTKASYEQACINYQLKGVYPSS